MDDLYLSIQEIVERNLKNRIIDLQSLVQDAIELNLKNRKRIDQEWGQNFGLFSYLRLFATIHINPGRGSGKSNFIRESFTDEDLVFVHSLDVKRNIYHDNQRVILASDSVLDRVRGIRANIIYIDEPSLVFHKLEQSGYNPDYLYHITGHSPDQLYILLGE